MAVRLNSISETTFHHRFPFPITSLGGDPRRRSVSLSFPCLCADRRNSSRPGADLATELASEVERIRARGKRKDEALRKIRGILFSEICDHFGTTEEEMRRRWRKMEEEEKAGFAREFVREWSVGFHPLSAKSVREMVDEHLGEGGVAAERSSSGSFPGGLSIFSGLKRLIGLSEEAA
ncbi:hypothetical protein MLD38_013732 [Melastoma candidum]|uniref:Uncharacterized protein n=1 Tax=Melastoma candidum TaxID=119954 RepID=A0ACB9REP4_9MYRT|nr:hypothetical protein MLD38_013732 [Melastoma candidum]